MNNRFVFKMILIQYEGKIMKKTKNEKNNWWFIACDRLNIKVAELVVLHFFRCYKRYMSISQYLFCSQFSSIIQFFSINLLILIQFFNRKILSKIRKLVISDILESNFLTSTIISHAKALKSLLLLLKQNAKFISVSDLKQL